MEQVESSTVNRAIQWTVLALAGVLCLSSGVLQAQETQSQAVDRLKDIATRLRVIRDDTRYEGTLYQAMRNSASAFVCTSGNTLGYFHLGGFWTVAAAMESTAGIGEYYTGNGLAVWLKEHLSGAARVGGGGMSSYELWNCINTGEIDPPGISDHVLEHETPYAHPIHQTAQHSMVGVGTGSLRASPGFQTGSPVNRDLEFIDPVDLLNSMMGLLRASGLDPSDMEVVRSVLLEGGFDFVNAVKDLPLLAQDVSDGARLANLPAAMTTLLAEGVPLLDNFMAPVRSSLESMLDTAVDGPCRIVVIPALEDLCQEGKERMDVFIEMLYRLEDVPELIGKRGSIVIDVFTGNAELPFSTGLYELANRVNQLARAINLDILEKLEAKASIAAAHAAEAIQMATHLFVGIPETGLGVAGAGASTVEEFKEMKSMMEDGLDLLESKACRTFSISKTQSFGFNGFYFSCSGSVSYNPCSTSSFPTPSFACGW